MTDYTHIIDRSSGGLRYLARDPAAGDMEEAIRGAIRAAKGEEDD